MGRNRNWTNKEVEYLKENWGKLSIPVLEMKLDRSQKAIKQKASKLKLLRFLDSGEYITMNMLLKIIGVDNGGYKITSWVKNRAFPVHTKKVCNKAVRVVKIEEFWVWADRNKTFLDFKNFEENALGREPAWVKTKRKEDREKARNYIFTPWSIQEDAKLKHYLGLFRYTYMDLSKMLRRTEGAIQRRICDLGLKERPVRQDNNIKWTEEEELKLKELIKSGMDYEHLSEQLGKSSRSLRGKVYRLYSTENLDKARSILKEGGKKI